MRGNSNELWAVILAAGDGRRLAPLTRLLYGAELPKQFAVLDGDRSLLQTTLERTAALVPPDRIVVVVGQGYETLAREQLAGYPGIDLAVQPRNLGTGPGILLPLARILARDAAARVAVFPSDHHVARPDPILSAVAAAAAATGRGDVRLALLGIVAERPEVEYGWILPGRPIPGAMGASVREVRRFVEKPDARLAKRLFRAGALWNSFISVGTVGQFWALAAEHLPRHVRSFESYVKRVGGEDDRELLAHVYREMEAANFSADVLQRATGLAVLPVRDSGWSDWGSPARVLLSLHGTAGHARLVERLGAAWSPATLAPSAAAGCPAGELA